MTETSRWLRVVIEAAVIVGSILLAFGIDAWWDARRERLQERQYLTRLVADLERSETSLRQTDDFYERQLVSASDALRVIEGRAAVPDDTIAFLASTFFPTRQVEPRLSRATYDDLISTGGLDLIMDPSLRDSIVTYFESVEARLFPTDYQLDRAPYRRTVRSLIPPELQFELQRCDRDPDTCVPPATGVSLSAVVEALLREPQLPGELRLLMQSTGIRTFDFALEATVALREAIQAHLLDE